MSANIATMNFSSTDLTKPNAGRIYDYLLGGSHNFEADRAAADQVVRLQPWSAKYARLQRSCLQDIAYELSNVRGYDVIIDLASGLPTQDHIHQIVKPGTTVIYSDRDPIVVEYARTILGDTPNVYIFTSDARTPLDLLNNPEVEKILQGRRDVAMVYWGVTGFMAPQDIKNSLKDLYDWSGPKSTLAFMAQGVDVATDDPGMKGILAMYEKMGSPIYTKSLQEYIDLMSPWRLDSGGFISLLNWHGIDSDILTPEEKLVWSNSGGGYGGYLVK